MGDRAKALEAAAKNPSERTQEDLRHLNECSNIQAVKNAAFKTEKRVKAFGDKKR